MIPRYAPTYSYLDLVQSIAMRNSDTSDELISRIQQLYQVKHVFLFDSARVALYVILKAYNQPGGVLMPAYNCIVVPEAVRFAGYEPVFIDIDLQTLNLSAEAIKASLTPKCKVMLATHLFGIPCDMNEIRDAIKGKNILLIEDAAPAFGAEYYGQKVGCFGDAAIISFQATKVISAENGGALLTNNDDFANKIIAFHAQASTTQGWIKLFINAFIRKLATNQILYPFTQAGFYIIRHPKMFEIVKPLEQMPKHFLSRCPSFSESLILRQMDRLPANLAMRRKIAQTYQQELNGLPWLSIPSIPKNCSPAWIQFPILINNKKGFYDFMQRNGVDLSWTFRYSCADSYGLKTFSNTTKAAKSMLGLPTYPSLTADQIKKICEIIKTYQPI